MKASVKRRVREYKGALRSDRFCGGAGDTSARYHVRSGNYGQTRQLLGLNSVLRSMANKLPPNPKRVVVQKVDGRHLNTHVSDEMIRAIRKMYKTSSFAQICSAFDLPYAYVRMVCIGEIRPFA